MGPKWALKHILGQKFRSQKLQISFKLKTSLRCLALKTTSICSSNCSIKRGLAGLIAQSDNSSNSRYNSRVYRLMHLRQKLGPRRRQGSSVAGLLLARSNLTVCSILRNRPIVHQLKHRRFKATSFRYRHNKPSQRTRLVMLQRSRQETIKLIYRVSRPFLTSMTCRAKPLILHLRQDQRCPWLKPLGLVREAPPSARMVGGRTTHIQNRKFKIPQPVSIRHVSPYSPQWPEIRSFRRQIKALEWRI